MLNKLLIFLKSDFLKRFDNKMALSFAGIIIVIFILTTSYSIALFNQVLTEEEDRLLESLASSLSVSISKVSFSGKYQIRLLVEEMVEKKKDILYISIESPNNKIIAHSNPKLNDRFGSASDFKENLESIKNNTSIFSEHQINGKVIKEIVHPFYGGYDSEVTGIVRIGIDKADVLANKRKNMFKISIFVLLLSFSGIISVKWLSTFFAKSAQVLAAQLEGILKYAPITIIISDDKGIIKAHSNSIADRFLSIEENDNLGNFYVKNLNKKLVQLLKKVDKEIFLNASNFDNEIRIKKNDSLRYWHVSKFPIERNELGKVLLMCTFIYDVSDLKKTEESLQETEDAFTRIFEFSADPILLIKNGVFIECNHATLSLLEYDKADFLNCTPESISPMFQADGRLSSESAKEKITDAFKKGYIRFDWIHTKKDDQPVYLDITLTPISFKGENHLYVTWRDMTEKKKADEEKEKLQRQLLQAQKMESIGRLAGGVAHDFNNMLSVINGYSEMTMLRLTKENPIYQFMIEIQKAGKRSVELTQQLLAFARKQEISPKVININDTIVGMLKMLQRLIGEEIDLAWIPGHNIWFTNIDPSQLHQILANLVVNSKDAIDGIGKVTIETDNTVIDESYCLSHPGSVIGDFVTLIVSDTGNGMNQELIQNIFEPFFTTKDIGKGTGLGLATVYGIVKQNQGFINVYSEPGKGTSFKIFFPRYLDNIQSIEENVKNEVSPTGTETILVVEDELSVLNYSKTLLESLGYHVLTANTPSEALELTENPLINFDLMITDVIMPIMNGKELSEKITILHPGIKCLFMSGYTANVIDRHGVLDESVNFIQKPFTLYSLAIKVRTILD